MSAQDACADERAGDWLDRALMQGSAERAETYIDDAGFTATVMAMLPAALAPASWRKPALLALWGVAIAGLAVTLPPTVLDVTREAVRLFAGRPFALSDIASIVAVTGAAMWTATWFAWRRA